MRSTSLVTAVRRALDAAGLGRRGQLLVVALSGGPDSTALLEALCSLRRERGFRVVAAHLDHRLRRAAAADARFCATLCRGLDVPLRTARADVKARARRDREGLEAAARSVRHAFLSQVAIAHGASAIALGHTQDDQAETLLLRLLRGAGGDGLAAMRPVSGIVGFRRRDEPVAGPMGAPSSTELLRPQTPVGETGAVLFRPLLAVARKDVLAHLARRGLRYREDESNRDPRHDRNRLRHDLLPRLEAAFHGRVRAHLAATAELLARDADALDAWARRALRQARGTRKGGSSVQGEDGLSCAVLLRRPEAVASRAIRLWLSENGGLAGVGRIHVETLLALCREGRGRFALPRGREAEVVRGRLLLSLAGVQRR